MRIAPKLLCRHLNGPGRKHRLLQLLVLLLVFLLPLFTVANGYEAAPITVSGKVTDDNGVAVTGVSVMEKGTSNGSITDANGRYQITVKGEDAVLVFSTVGYSMKETLVGTRTTIDVIIASDATQLADVVITALGIERSSKGLGYSTAKVKPEELTVNRTTNMMNALTGKIAGVSISGLGTGPAGTSKIRIRGQTSIAGQNNPLIVINGVPVDNTNFGSNPGNAGSDNSISTRGGGVTSDGGDAFSSINPDDIESMTVLKGAAASALYGSRGNNGVIMITTKTKGSTKGIGVTYNLNYSMDTPLDFTDYQKEYGQGENGVRPTAANPTSGQWSFGEKFAPGLTHALFNNLAVPYQPQGSRIDEFYRTGQNMTHTVTLGASNDKGGIHLSFANLKSLGIIEGNSFDRKTLNLGFSYELSDQLQFRGNINYSNEYNRNPPNVGNQDNTIPTALMAMANSMPLSVLEANKYDDQRNEYVYSRFRNRTNPYFVMTD